MSCTREDDTKEDHRHQKNRGSDNNRCVPKDDCERKERMWQQKREDTVSYKIVPSPWYGTAMVQDDMKHDKCVQLSHIPRHVTSSISKDEPTSTPSIFNARIPYQKGSNASRDYDHIWSWDYCSGGSYPSASSTDTCENKKIPHQCKDIKTGNTIYYSDMEIGTEGEESMRTMKSSYLPYKLSTLQETSYQRNKLSTLQRNKLLPSSREKKSKKQVIYFTKDNDHIPYKMLEQYSDNDSDDNNIFDTDDDNENDIQLCNDYDWKDTLDHISNNISFCDDKRSEIEKSDSKRKSVFHHQMDIENNTSRSEIAQRGRHIENRENIKNNVSYGQDERCQDFSTNKKINNIEYHISNGDDKQCEDHFIDNKRENVHSSTHVKDVECKIHFKDQNRESLKDKIYDTHYHYCEAPFIERSTAHPHDVAQSSKCLEIKSDVHTLENKQSKDLTIHNKSLQIYYLEDNTKSHNFILTKERKDESLRRYLDDENEDQNTVNDIRVHRQRVHRQNKVHRHDKVHRQQGSHTTDYKRDDNIRVHRQNNHTTIDNELDEKHSVYKRDDNIRVHRQNNHTTMVDDLKHVSFEDDVLPTYYKDDNNLLSHEDVSLRITDGYALLKEDDSEDDTVPEHFVSSISFLENDNDQVRDHFESVIEENNSDGVHRYGVKESEMDGTDDTVADVLYEQNDDENVSEDDGCDLLSQENDMIDDCAPLHEISSLRVHQNGKHRNNAVLTHNRIVHNGASLTSDKIVPTDLNHVVTNVSPIMVSKINHESNQSVSVNYVKKQLSATESTGNVMASVDEYIQSVPVNGSKQELSSKESSGNVLHNDQTVSPSTFPHIYLANGEKLFLFSKEGSDDMVQRCDMELVESLPSDASLGCKQFKLITIRDLQVEVAKKLKRFAPDILIFDLDSGKPLSLEKVTGSIEGYQRLQAIFVPTMARTADFWLQTLRMHRRAQDWDGCERAIIAMGDGAPDPDPELYDVIPTFRQLCLKEAICWNDVRLVKFLLTLKTPLEYADHFRNTCLGHATFRGYSQLVYILLQGGANLEHTDQFGNTSLSKVAVTGHVPTLLILLEAKANIEHSDCFGNTPLCLASISGKFDIVTLLLRHKARVNHTNRDGQIPLQLAAKHGFTNIVNLLLPHYEDRDHINQALVQAMLGGHFETVRSLLAAGAGLTQSEHQLRRDNRETSVPLSYFGCCHTHVDNSDEVLNEHVQIGES